jgi:hypothetical protein
MACCMFTSFVKIFCITLIYLLRVECFVWQSCLYICYVFRVAVVFLYLLRVECFVWQSCLYICYVLSVSCGSRISKVASDTMLFELFVRN